MFVNRVRIRCPRCRSFLPRYSPVSGFLHCSRCDVSFAAGALKC